MKLTLQFEFDPNDPKNLYEPEFSTFKNFSQAVLSNDITPGTSIYLEFGTGDVIASGTLIRLVELEI